MRAFPFFSPLRIVLIVFVRLFIREFGRKINVCQRLHLLAEMAPTLTVWARTGKRCCTQKLVETTGNCKALRASCCFAGA